MMLSVPMERYLGAVELIRRLAEKLEEGHGGLCRGCETERLLEEAREYE
jgi:hypothetical protein